MSKKKNLSPGQERQDRQEEAKKFESEKQRLILHLLEQGILTKESLSLDDANVKKLYERAYQLYSAGKYKNAKSLFALLLIFNPSDFNFIYGLAACHLMLKEYEEAAEGYIQCGMLDPQNPLPYFYAADCYLNKNDLVSTCMALRIAIKRSQQKPEYAEVKNRAKLTLDALMPSKAGAQSKP